LSYRRARESGSEGGSATMTVCTNDVALCNLGEDRLPVAVPKSFGYAECLVAEVVELQHQRIALATVGAWMFAQELD
jgi:hypothetical protein